MLSIQKVTTGLHELFWDCFRSMSSSKQHWRAGRLSFTAGFQHSNAAHHWRHSPPSSHVVSRQRHIPVSGCVGLDASLPAGVQHQAQPWIPQVHPEEGTGSSQSFTSLQHCTYLRLPLDLQLMPKAGSSFLTQAKLQVI